MNSRINFHKLSEINSDDNINEEELSFNAPSPFENIIDISNHVKVLNSSNFNVKFVLKYILDNKNATSNSGDIFPSYARQISIPKKALSLNLTIYSIPYIEQNLIIYNSDLKLNQTYEFTVTGTIAAPVVTES